MCVVRRWGYANVSETKEQVTNMRAAGVPLESVFSFLSYSEFCADGRDDCIAMWNDIDLYWAYRDFTSDPVSFPGDEMRAFINGLHADNQHCKHILVRCCFVE